MIFVLSYVAINAEFHTFSETLSHIDTENARFHRKICIRIIVSFVCVCIAVCMCPQNGNSPLKQTAEKREWILICAFKMFQNEK